MNPVGLIWAEQNGVIGDGETMPWHLPEDLKHFAEITAGATVLMGRRTWESIPARFRPLRGRRNLVLTRGEFHDEGAEAYSSLESAFAAVEADSSVWVIGGGEVYRQALGFATLIERTVILGSAEGSVAAPLIPGRFALEDESPLYVSTSGLEYRFQRWRSATA